MNKVLLFALIVLICYNISLYASPPYEPIEHTCILPPPEIHNTGNARLDRIMNSKSSSMIEREDRAYDDVIEMYDMVDSNDGIPTEQPEPVEGVTLPNFGPMKYMPEELEDSL